MRVRHFLLTRYCLVRVSLILFSLLATSLSVAHASEALLNSKCSACHVAEPDGSLSRINAQRKTPEGWNMTLFRMEQVHGMQIGDDERRTLIKYLADTNGLAPEEAVSQRPILERQPDYIESPPDADLAVLCARCHTWGRVALQRRSEAEWLKHVHFHVGQFPTIEYQAMARDRDWFDDAVNIAVPALATMLPLDSAEWQAWQQADKPTAQGEWIAFGHWPGRGDFHATLTADGDGDQLGLSVKGQYSDGESLDADGSAIIYTGYEWRARAGKLHQVMALSEDGLRLSGRWFEADNDSLGAQVVAVRIGSGAGVIGISPAAVRAGQTTSLTLYGDGLSEQLSAEGITFSNASLSADGTTLTVDVEVAADAMAGPRLLGGDAELIVYTQIDSIAVEPAETIARVGSNGGPIASVPAQFDAIAWANGADGEPGTDDDLRIGHVNANWSVSGFDELAEQEQDARFAGAIDAATGLFMPAGAGPNPDRRYSTNNAGNLTVNAVVEENDQQLTGSGHLIVTVQRFNDPPIR
jgi:quinohemoprotein amine dehydrogenase